MNRREIKLTRSTLQYDYTCFANGTKGIEFLPLTQIFKPLYLFNLIAKLKNPKPFLSPSAKFQIKPGSNE